VKVVLLKSPTHQNYVCKEKISFNSRIFTSIHAEYQINNPQMDKQISGLLKSKIQDLTTLKDRIPCSLLVAFDLEFSIHGISEAGIAFLRLTKEQPAPALPDDGTLRTFYAQNNIKTYSIQVCERIKKKTSREAVKYGSIMPVNDKELGITILQLISSARSHSEPTILVGFSLYAESKWISEFCPSLASLFTACVDLQEIVAEKSGIGSSGLLDAMNAMKIVDRPSGTNPPSKHGASNDAVRCLAVLAGLLGLDAFTFPSKFCKHVRLACLSRIPTPSKKYPFTARITTADGGILPPHYNTPISLYELFKKYLPNAVALNSQNGLPKSNGWKVWWLSFSSIEFLREFYLKINGSGIDGSKIVVECIIRNAAQSTKDDSVRRQTHTTLVTTWK
jgi:hypothetical protein